MKKLTFCFFFAISLFAKAQTISPAITDEYCPLTQYNFTITITGLLTTAYLTDQIQISSGSVTNSSYNSSTNQTILTLAVQFTDNPSNHSFRIAYYIDGDPDIHYTTTYTATKVKSLAGDNRQVSPNVATITKDICNTTGVAINFANLAWKNSTSGTTFGTISNYAYYIPQSWSVAGSTSTGITSPIIGTNSETITPDNLNGHGQTILIVPVNSCAGYSTSAGYPFPFSVSRPLPTLSTSATNICSSNYTFTVNNIPSGSSTTWTYSSNISVVGTPTASQITVTRNGSTNAMGYIQAVVSVPCTTATYTSRVDIQVGLATPGIY